MKVRVTVTLDVDPDAWATEYGLERVEVRAHVAESVRCWSVEQAAMLGLLEER